MTAVRDCTAHLLEALPSLILVSGKYPSIPPIINRINQLRGALNEAENAMAEVIGNGIVVGNETLLLTSAPENTDPLDPDVSGIYLKVADYAGQKAWTRQDGAWSIWYDGSFENYQLTPIIGTIPDLPAPSWFQPDGGPEYLGNYEPADSGAGKDVVATN